MSTQVVDPHLARAVHVARQRRAAFAAADPRPRRPGEHDPHDVWQVATIQALLDGAYEGDLTLGELLAHGDLGLGTVQHLDGELVVLDGEAFAVRSDGRVDRLGDDVRTPFAVVCRFAPVATGEVEHLDLEELAEVLDHLAPADEPVVAVRVDGTFADVGLRSVPAQEPPYPSLTEVVQHQTTWSVRSVTGSVVGFRFPGALQGVEVPGYHLHLLSSDRTVGGHVTALTVVEGVVAVDGAHELHLEVPTGRPLDGAAPDAGEETAAAIRAVEGGAATSGGDAPGRRDGPL